MTANQIFEAMLQDPILQEKYDISMEELRSMKLHENSGYDIIEIIKFVIMGVENNIPDRSINSQVKNHFKI